ncbi:TonB-dependent receptor [Duganella sp. sic0402]|uniref:TonB-dependent receptor n=1 Tax=Duganella sp. sic0402 TaxID=2854786 RepID=UPI001C465F73|nr:TonB-dependent receptor [Duganella sp. sic0402]MBV7534734.1 TonB-dependent receptor [Duganella sp. sic0402]
MKTTAHKNSTPRLSALTVGVLTMLAGVNHAAAQTGAQAETSNAATALAASANSVVIAGQRSSLRNAIAAQEKADNIVSVISSDDIGGLPDKNAAEALARLPGVSVQRDQGEGRYVSVRGLGPDLNAVTINGALVPSPEAGRRAVALDVLPAGLIRSLEVSKTLTPDQDANSLGGTVEVKTLSAFDLPGKLLSGAIGASRDQNIGKTSPNGSILFADRLLDGKLGVAGGLSFEKREFGSDNVETGGAWDEGKLAGVELRDYLPTRERRAAALNLDYRVDDNSKYFLRSFISDFSDDEVRDRLTISNVAGGGLAVGQTAAARGERRLRQRKYTQTISSVVAGTEHKWDGWKLEVSGGMSKAKDDAPESINDARFRGKSNFSNVGFTDTQIPRLTGPDGLYDASNYKLNSLALKQSYAEDKEHHIRFDLGRKYDLGEGTGKFKFGAKLSRREKDNNTEVWSYSSSQIGSASTALADYVSGSELDFKLGRIGKAIDPAKIRQLASGLSRAKARVLVDSTVDDYGLKEDIDAGYLQHSYDIDAWHLLAGVRVERTRFEAAGNNINEEDETISAVSRKRSYNNWLPTLQARYDLDGKTSVRAALTHSVVRANFDQLKPGISQSSDTEATIGNPDLAPLKSTNLDLGIERVLGEDGAVSAYVFHKGIKNFTYTTNLAGSGAWANYSSAITYANGDKASVKGIELSYMQPLRMLPAPFNHLIVGANGSITRSDANIARFDTDAKRMRSRSINLPGQSDRVMNLMLGYEDGPLSARIAVNYKSPYLLELGDDILDSKQDRIVDTQKQVDFSASYQLTKQLQLNFEAANLNHEKYYTYLGSKAYNAQYEQYGRTYKLSLKVSLF